LYRRHPTVTRPVPVLLQPTTVRPPALALTRSSARPFPLGRLGENAEQLPVVLLERPLPRRLPGRLRARAAALRVHQLPQTPCQPLVVVRVIDDVPFLQRVQQLARPVGPRRDNGQPAR